MKAQGKITAVTETITGFDDDTEEPWATYTVRGNFSITREQFLELTRAKFRETPVEVEIQLLQTDLLDGAGEGEGAEAAVKAA